MSLSSERERDGGGAWIWVGSSCRLHWSGQNMLTANTKGPSKQNGGKSESFLCNSVSLHTCLMPWKHRSERIYSPRLTFTHCSFYYISYTCIYTPLLYITYSFVHFLINYGLSYRSFAFITFQKINNTFQLYCEVGVLQCNGVGNMSY